MEGVGTPSQSHQRFLDRLDEPRQWVMENLKILAVIWSKFEADDDWPNAKLLQRELFVQGELFDSNAFVWNIPPSMGRYDGSSGKIMLTPRALCFVEAADRSSIG